MKRTFVLLATSGLICTFMTGPAVADSHADSELDPASPIELFTCNYNEGQGPADLDKAVDAWNAWADRQNLAEYSAWTRGPFDA